MSDWSAISGQEFHAQVTQQTRLELLVGTLIIDRLPFTFDDKQQYFTWRHALGEGLEVDPRDIVIVGSCATGRSLNPRKQFRPLNQASDVDIAVVSSRHFDIAWSWFRRTNPIILGLDDKGQRLFAQHQSQYIFDGMIAANYFLSYLPFGADWNRELQRSETYLPSRLRGRPLLMRIYKDSEALRRSQVAGLRGYKTYLDGGKVDEGASEP